MSEWDVAGAPEPLDTSWTIAKDQPMERSWDDVGKGAFHNVGRSAGQTLKDLVKPVVHPVQTVTEMGHLGSGILQKVGIMSGDEDVKYADAVGRYFADRYGGMENIKKTMAEDPVGFLMDVSTILSGGETALARAPGMIGRTGEIMGAAGRATNPLTGPAKAVAYGAEKIAPGAIGELATHTGADSLAEAAKAGYLGGEGNKKFLAQMTGMAPSSEVVDEALKGTRAMRKAMTDAYNKYIGPILKDATVLDFTRVRDAIRQVEDVQNFKGLSGIGPEISLNPETSKVRNDIERLVSKFEREDPREYHTIAGMDALKKGIGKIYRETEPNTPDRVVAGKIYTAVKNTIALQNPKYGNVMSEYEGALEGLNEVEKELSLGEKNTYGTSLRKLQSIMRNNASTANRHRKELGQALVDAGAEHLMPMLAGQALEPRFARGLGRMVPTALGGGAMEAAATGHMGLGAGLAAAAGAAGVSSPRLMGQTANKLGMAARPFKYVPPDKASQTMFQLGQMTSPLDNIVEQGLNKKPKDETWVPVSE